MVSRRMSFPMSFIRFSSPLNRVTHFEEQRLIELREIVAGRQDAIVAVAEVEDRLPVDFVTIQNRALETGIVRRRGNCCRRAALRGTPRRWRRFSTRDRINRRRYGSRLQRDGSESAARAAAFR